MKNKVLYSIIALLTIMLASQSETVTGFFHADHVEAKDRSPAEAVKPVPADTRKPVAVMQVNEGPLVRQVVSHGYVSAARTAEIMAQVSARIHRLFVQEGDWVEQGNTVVALEDDLLRIAQQQAQEELDKALAQYANIAFFASDRGNRKQVLNRLGVDSTNADDVEAFRLIFSKSRKELAADQVGLDEARLKLKRAQLELEHAIIGAPFAGYVSEVVVDRSDFVNKGDVVARVVSLDRLRLEMDVLETEIRHIRLGARAEIELAALPMKTVSGRVVAVNPTIDAERRTCRVLIEIENPDRAVRPGMFADVRVEAARYEDRLLVPREALLTRNDRKVVFAYEGGRAKWCYVETGEETNEMVEVREGLTAGDTLITAGHFNLSHNAQVIVVNEEL
ncbi:MAG: efflux RND transporter periplasmic adaptor subunit [Gemmatimonadetes bacterium]|nr:efflux RND transporter periplasmic adaptor subunit [Gemmatimonadota bacterium]MXY80642.1 efflux RND transporter periplasmic adaptor subunit [Gemmatimonadota bacterium]MYB67370.1 efflux RND transporter periplasmic adaptor subunit [Gemmatimonadota bacterium]